MAEGIRKRVEAILFDPKDKNSIYVGEGRFGLSLPGGGLEDHEKDKLEAARREVAEEFGFTSNLQSFGHRPRVDRWDSSTAKTLYTGAKGHRPSDGAKTYFFAGEMTGKDHSLYGADGDAMQPKKIPISKAIEYFKERANDPSNKFHECDKTRVKALEKAMNNFVNSKEATVIDLEEMGRKHPGTGSDTAAEMDRILRNRANRASAAVQARNMGSGLVKGGLIGGLAGGITNKLLGRDFADGASVGAATGGLGGLTAGAFGRRMGILAPTIMGGIGGLVGGGSSSKAASEQHTGDMPVSKVKNSYNVGFGEGIKQACIKLAHDAGMDANEIYNEVMGKLANDMQPQQQQGGALNTAGNIALGTGVAAGGLGGLAYGAGMLGEHTQNVDDQYYSALRNNRDARRANRLAQANVGTTAKQMEDAVTLAKTNRNLAEARQAPAGVNQAAYDNMFFDKKPGKGYAAHARELQRQMPTELGDVVGSDNVAAKVRDLHKRRIAEAENALTQAQQLAFSKNTHAVNSAAGAKIKAQEARQALNTASDAAGGFLPRMGRALGFGGKDTMEFMDPGLLKNPLTKRLAIGGGSLAALGLGAKALSGMGGGQQVPPQQ